MKKILVALLALSVISSCEKKEDDYSLVAGIEGLWIHTGELGETVQFFEPPVALVNNNPYSYVIWFDSIIFEYEGNMGYSYHTLKFELRNQGQSLMIEDMDKVLFFTGNSGENIFIRGQ